MNDQCPSRNDQGMTKARTIAAAAGAWVIAALGYSLVIGAWSFVIA
jgi:hypothetical protein